MVYVQLYSDVFSGEPLAWAMTSGSVECPVSRAESRVGSSRLASVLRDNCERGQRRASARGLATYGSDLARPTQGPGEGARAGILALRVNVVVRQPDVDQAAAAEDGREGEGAARAEVVRIELQRAEAAVRRECLRRSHRAHV